MMHAGRVAIVAVAFLIFGASVVSFAQGPQKQEPTPEQKQLYMEMHGKMEALKQDCMGKMQALRAEYEPKFQALGMPMPGGQGGGMQGGKGGMQGGGMQKPPTR